MSFKDPNAPEGKCPVIVSDGWKSHACLRPIKRNGLCGIHASHEDRRLARQQEAEQRRKAARLSKLLGISVTPEWQGGYRIPRGAVNQYLAEHPE